MRSVTTALWLAGAGCVDGEVRLTFQVAEEGEHVFPLDARPVVNSLCVYVFDAGYTYQGVLDQLGHQGWADHREACDLGTAGTGAYSNNFVFAYDPERKAVVLDAYRPGVGAEVLVTYAPL